MKDLLKGQHRAAALSSALRRRTGRYRGLRLVSSSAEFAPGKMVRGIAASGNALGRLLYPGPSDLFHVIQMEIPAAVADQMFRLDSLDQIGPARYAEGDVLTAINQQYLGISEVPLTIAGGP